MANGPKHKRIRVRLRASTIGELRAKFASELTEDGVKLRVQDAPPVGTKIRLIITYVDDRPVLSGLGEIVEYRDGILRLKVAWDPRCQKLITQIIAGTVGDPLDQVPDIVSEVSGPISLDLDSNTIEALRDSDLDPDELRRAKEASTEYGLASGELKSRKESVNDPPQSGALIGRLTLSRSKSGEWSSDDSGNLPRTDDEADTPAPSARVVGIDFGTSWTRVAAIRGAEPFMVPSRRGGPQMPSAVLIRPNGKTNVGEPAVRKLGADPHHGLLRAKRIIGRTPGSARFQEYRKDHGTKFVVDVRGAASLAVTEEPTSIPTALAALFSEARESTQRVLEMRVNRAVLNVPNDFGHRPRWSLLEAAREGGLMVEHLLSDCAAVALSYGIYQPKDPEEVLVLDMGTSGLRAAHVEVLPGGARVLRSVCDSNVGGFDFDAGVVSLLTEALSRRVEPSALADPRAQESARRLAELIKVRLDHEDNCAVEYELPDGGDPLEISVSRMIAEEAWAPLIESICRIVDSFTDLTTGSRIILSGPSWRMPSLQRVLRERFAPERMVLDERLAPVFGAARFAHALGEGQPLSVEDRLGRDICAWVPGAAPTRVLEPGMTLPCSGSAHFDQGQLMRSGRVMFFEGMPDDVASAEPIGTLQLDESQRRSTIMLKLSVDVHGLFSLAATDAQTGKPVIGHFSRDLSALVEEPEAETAFGGLGRWLRSIVAR